MRDHINISGVSGSIIAAGQGSSARGVVTNGTPPDAAAARAELDKLVEELQAAERPEARRHAENLREAIDDAAPEAVGRSYGKLRAALGGLAVTANLAQIGQFVQGFLT